jgi:hypothetical protein
MKPKKRKPRQLGWGIANSDGVVVELARTRGYARSRVVYYYGPDFSVVPVIVKLAPRKK